MAQLNDRLFHDGERLRTRPSRDAVAVCHERGEIDAALAIATTLRRAGIPADLPLAGKPARQFERGKAQGYCTIITAKGAGVARLWADWRAAHEGTASEITDYLIWLDDDTDTVPEPVIARGLPD